MAAVMLRRISKSRRLFAATISGSSSLLARSFSVARRNTKTSFGIAFDIDGVLLRASKPLGGAPQALARLYQGPSVISKPRVPFMLFTNGGGFPERKKASELSNLLNVNLSSNQIFLGHTSFKALASCDRDRRALGVGKGEPANVLSDYGFTNVIAVEDYVCEFDCIDPLEQYKPWGRSGSSAIKEGNRDEIGSVFVVSDPVDWGRDIQVICDVLRGGGNPLRLKGKAPPLFFAADDLIYQAAFPVVRFGMGAFRIALESVYTRLTGTPLVYTSFGKPTVAAYTQVKQALQHLAGSIDPLEASSNPGSAELQTIYMVGDNPATDIRGAKEAGKPWFSILVRTGCFHGQGNDEEFPADQVVEDVEEAVDFILRREKLD